jgi:hypothetical protein
MYAHGNPRNDLIGISDFKMRVAINKGIFRRAERNCDEAIVYE